MILTPSALARRNAGNDRLWPQVQRQMKCAPGVFGFSCAGHGGLVGIVPAMSDVDDHLLDGARATGKIENWTVVRDGRGTKVYGPELFAGDGDHAITNRSLRDSWFASTGVECEVVEVWIGEEDCDWATIASIPAVLDGAIEAGYLAKGVTSADVFGCLERWNPEYLMAIGA